jgi:hypothetical protein
MLKTLVPVLFVVMSLLNSSNVYAGPDHDVAGKKPGDIIAPLTDDKIAAWCDFNKQIVVTKTNVLCVYNGVQ